MTTLLVHLHVFYHEQVDYFLSKLGSIRDCDWDLVVTFSERRQQTEDRIRAFKPDARFMEVENVGYDVWPFIKVLKSPDAKDYRYILKLHTKNVDPHVNKVNGLKLSGSRWRDILVDSLLGSPVRFADCLRRMESDSRSGFIYAYELKRKRSKGMTGIIHEAKRIGVSELGGEYASGTMFLARTEALRTIAEADISSEMFAKDRSRSHSRISLAHVYEQLICFAMQDAGYRALRVPAGTADSVRVFVHRMVSPVLKFVFSLEREGTDDAKVLTVLGVKLKMGSDKTV